MTLPPSGLVVCVQDWTRPGPYDQTLLVNTMKRSRDPGAHQQGGDIGHGQGEETRLLRGNHLMTSHKVRGRPGVQGNMTAEGSENIAFFFFYGTNWLIRPRPFYKKMSPCCRG